MTSLTEMELLKEFLVDRTNFKECISFARFKKMFPKGISEIAVKNVYKHLKRINHRNRQNLENVITQDKSNSNLNKVPSSLFSQTEDIEKVIKNLNDLDSIIDVELQRITKEREEELLKLKSITNNLNEQNIENDTSEEFSGSSTIGDISNELQILLKE
ncbi:hypothetical protein BN7_303 [Wickerhamomyces ciferrii]|uniref:Uncharacterized protein n=1 Tax=Wickerhamomyces ciferrii (strain ATCC 14091 / BCRC 22168 / CBS 111 / JCM 3599 / NBRC 0793 / NRRL Y-1031 F-60-10) TaxID=1206466 RepID=K0KHF3_WICCF|nr:uncharacterized protein BN7_303 [Wickerhamomyces ciferrii]CCH40769.1 hypothetical protein BN7_303 [Wickerhamomyces ciferrii]